MCGRFTQLFTEEEIYRLYDLAGVFAPCIHRSWNLCPTQEVGVIAPEAYGRIYLMMHWGLVPMWARNPRIGGFAFNARLSAAPRKPAFSGAWKARRCLIPASGFYEWRAVDTDGKPDADKMPFYISRKDGLPFTFAGLWESWRDGRLSCTILTTDACDGAGPFRDRMPVMLDWEAFDGWLSGGNPALCRGIDEAVQAIPVSPKMNSPHYDQPDCIAPLKGAGPVFL